MRHLFKVLWPAMFFCLAACGSSHKLSQGKAKDKIRELDLFELKDKQVQIEKISQSGDNNAVAEANLKMTFKLSRNSGGDWKVDAVRLGDRDWVDLKAFVEALDRARLSQTEKDLQELVVALRKFKEQTGRYPTARTIVELTDTLFPRYLPQLVRYDGWNRELLVNSVPPSLEVVSLGADGIRGTADDVAVEP